MSATQRIVWIALPNGLTSPDASGRARISVFVSPQLRPDAAETLEPFDFLDWPQRLVSGAIGLKVEMGGVTVDADVVSTPDSRLWSALFDAQTFVRPHVLDATSPVYGSYPAARVHDFLKSGYQEVGTESPLDAVSPTAFSEVRDLIGLVPDGVDRDDTTLSERDRRVRLATRLLGPATNDELNARLDLLVDVARDESARSAEAGAAPTFVPIVPDTGDDASMLAQFLVYHRQPTGSVRLDDDPSPADTRLDFHQRISSLGDYPAALRLLGLVIDLELDQSQVPEASSDTPGLVRVIPSFPSPAVDTTSVTPGTAYAFTSGRTFAAAPTPASADMPEIVSGLLNLNLPASDGSTEDRFRILQVDIDGAGLSALDVLARQTRGDIDTATGEVLPGFAPSPMRSGGVSITRAGEARLLHVALATGRRKMEALARGETETLFAEDLLRGLRVDVGDPASGTWRSLHERDGRYTFSELGEERLISDEGWIEPVLVQPEAGGRRPKNSAPDESVPNYVSESLFLWQGWSLSANRPGEVISRPASTPPAGAEPGEELGLEVSFSATKGSLPRLRFGQRYTFRARTVDLAGNGLDIEQATRGLSELPGDLPILPRPAADPALDEEFQFLRFEVVPSPILVARGPTSAGESVDRIVLRSTPGLTPEEFAQLHADAHPEYATAAERHVAPPVTWQLLAETFGLFDSSVGTRSDHERTHQLGIREKRVPPADGVHGGPVLPVDYLPDPLAAGASFRNLPGVPDGSIGRVVGGSLEFSELPGTGERRHDLGSVVVIDFGPQSAWPDRSPFRLRLAEGTGLPVWDATERVLTVLMPKGDTRTVRVSCHLENDAALSLLGIWGWIVEGLRSQVLQGRLTEAEMATRVEELRQLSLLGLSRMITPYRELTLVHAVQQPVAPSGFSFEPGRVASATFAYTRGAVRIDRASTGTVEVMARWTEKLEDPLHPDLPPSDVAFEAPVFAAPFAVPDPMGTGGSAPTRLPLPAAHFDVATSTVEFWGPRLESLDAEVEAAAASLVAGQQDLVLAAAGARLTKPNEIPERFNVNVSGALAKVPKPPGAERWAAMAGLGRRFAAAAETAADGIVGSFEFPGEVPGVTPDPQELVPPLRAIQSAGLELASAADGALTMSEKFQGRHEFGDTKHRRVSYQAVATTRFGECFDPTAGQPAVTATSEVTTVDVKSSERPPLPGIQHIVPAFAWKRTPQSEGPPAEEFSSERRGALRVHLERPWHASGDGELLGVVVASSPNEEAGLRRSTTPVTRMGRDPLWTSLPSRSLPTPADFRNAVAAHQMGATTVLGFPVDFDERGRCFCDIELSPGQTYHPFVQLALVRYQPMSIRGTETSAVVVADFAQLVPDRAVTMVRRAEDLFAVTVGGPTHESQVNPLDEAAGLGTRIRVGVQRRIPGTSDDAGWLPATDGVVVVPETGVPTGSRLWSGTVTIRPAPVPGQHRLLVEEMEAHRGLDASGFRLVERVVFVETIEV